MSKSKGKPERVQIPCVTLHKEVWKHLMEIKTARACPLGMAIDELYFELQRLKQRLADWQATAHMETASHD